MTNSVDLAAIQALIDTSGYNAVADMDLDGNIDVDDKALADLSTGTSLGFSVLSASSEDSRIGYHGSLSIGVRLLDRRHRYHDPRTGRWLLRDPLGYVDGPNLYEHVRSSPMVFQDPLGLDVLGGWAGGTTVINSTGVTIEVHGDDDSLLFPDKKIDPLPDGGNSSEAGWGDADGVVVTCSGGENAYYVDTNGWDVCVVSCPFVFIDPQPYVCCQYTSSSSSVGGPPAVVVDYFTGDIQGIQTGSNRGVGQPPGLVQN